MRFVPRTAIAVAIFLSASPSQAQGDIPVPTTEYRRLLEATQFVDNYKKTAAVSARVFAARGQGSDKQYAAFMGVVAKADLSDIGGCLVDVYKTQNLSQQDVSSLIAFFESTLGQKLLLEGRRMMEADIERGSHQALAADAFTEEEKRGINEVQKTEWYMKYARMTADRGVAAANMNCIVQSHAVKSSGIKF